MTSNKRREGEAWRYLKGGTVTHYLGVVGFDNIFGPRSMAECGASALHSSDWRGTGTQDEYERAASLRECKKCLRILKRE